MKSQDLIERVCALAGVEASSDLAWRITQAEGTARERLARAAADGPTQRLLRKTFIVTASGGEASLSVPLTADEPLLLEHFENVSVYVTGLDYPAKPLPDRGAQALEDAGRASWALEGQTLVVKGTDGPYDGPVEIRNAPYVPLLSAINPPLDGLLVEIVAGMVAPSTSSTQPKGNA